MLDIIIRWFQRHRGRSTPAGSTINMERVTRLLLLFNVIKQLADQSQNFVCVMPSSFNFCIHLCTPLVIYIEIIVEIIVLIIINLICVITILKEQYGLFYWRAFAFILSHFYCLKNKINRQLM